jgi:ubiquinone/menaquinone biosynthesis C-methylase UbiE
MTHLPSVSNADIWSEWLLTARYQGGQTRHSEVSDWFEGSVDCILDHAKLFAHVALLDLACGDGLLAFRAIARIGPSLQATLVDNSAPILRYAEAEAARRNIQGQCSYLLASAEKLDSVANATMDVVAARSVLAYVSDKRAVLNECYRVLKPGGRLSLGEPILRNEALVASALRRTASAGTAAAADPAMGLLHRWKSAQFPDMKEQIAANPMTNYSERDLLAYVQDAGFADIHLELHIDTLSATPISWEIFLDSSPHPLVPSTRQILDERFTAAEQQLFVRIARPLIEKNVSLTTNCIAYVVATKGISDD